MAKNKKNSEQDSWIWKKTKDTFVNPYNFVSLDKKCNREHPNHSVKEIFEQKDLLTGWIECVMTSKTPLFVPHSANSDAFLTFLKRTSNNEVIKSYDFFSYDTVDGDRSEQYSEPKIPGSEIRGVIRSAFEAVTASCMSCIDDEGEGDEIKGVLYKRTSEIGQLGRLVYNEEKEKWEIQPCTRAKISIKTCEEKRVYDWDEGEEVSITLNKNQPITEIQRGSKGNMKQGYLHIGEKGENKRYESVFILKEREKPLFIDQDSVDRLKLNIGLYQDLTVNIHKKDGKHNGYPKYSIDHKGTLVYYKERKGIYYLSPAAISREVFHNRLKSLLKDFAPCGDIDKLCPACALFGMMSKKKSLASRLRFTDAWIANGSKKRALKDYYDPAVILPELSSPKPSATEFYLQKPDGADLWNYDYAGEWKEEKSRSIFNDISAYTPQIRGRKFYWHHKIDKAPKEKKGLESVRNVCVRPLQKEISFTFKIYFDSISENELKNLCYVLSPSENRCHKLGMGKPLGLGSIKIDAPKIKVRKLSLQKGKIEHAIEEFSVPNFPSETEKIAEMLGCSPNVLEKFLMMTDWEKAPQKISYPQATNHKEREPAKTGTHLWFVGNKQIPPGTGVSPVIHATLPEIKDEVEERSEKLVKYKKIKKESSGKD